MSTTEDRGELQVYELGYLVLPSMAEDKLSDTVSMFRKIITDQDGILLDSEEPFLRDLAYPMSKIVGASKYVVNNAYIGWQKFEAEPSKIGTIKSEIEKIPEILRHLLIKTERETKFTFAMARKAREEAENPEVVEVAEAEVLPAEAEVAPAEPDAVVE